MKDVTDEMPHLQVQGPLARDVLRPITEGADIDTLRYFRFLTDGVSVGGVPVWLSRTGYSGELGFELYCKPEDASRAVERRGAVRRAARSAADRALGDRDVAGSNPDCCSPTSTTSRTRPTRSRCGSTT